MSEAHPWILGLSDKDPSEMEIAINARLRKNATADLLPLINRVSDFAPYQIEFARGKGYILCVRKANGGNPTGNVTDNLYIAQPMDDSALENRVAYFEPSVQPLLRDFLSKFAGSGEEKEGVISGQFAFSEDVSAEDVVTHEPEVLGDWKTARLLYTALNGDMVYVNQSSGTAWHVAETNEVVPLFDRFSDFIKHYAAFRAKSEVFDFWESQAELGQHPSSA